MDEREMSDEEREQLEDEQLQRDELAGDASEPASEPELQTKYDEGPDMPSAISTGITGVSPGGGLQPARGPGRGGGSPGAGGRHCWLSPTRRIRGVSITVTPPVHTARRNQIEQRHRRQAGHQLDAL